MSDKPDKPKAPDKNDGKRTSSDRKDDPPKPLEHVSVDVNASPNDRRKPADQQVAQKVREGMKKKVKEAIEKSKDGGHERQLDAAREAAQEEGKKISKQHIREVKVRIDADVEKNGKRKGIHREIDVKPGD